MFMFIFISSHYHSLTSFYFHFGFYFDFDFVARTRIANVLESDRSLGAHTHPSKFEALVLEENLHNQHRSRGHPGEPVKSWEMHAAQKAPPEM